MEERALTFSVNGEFITNLAREQLYCEGKAEYAMKLLLSCMDGTDTPESQLREMAFSILDGYAELRGTYPKEDYGYYRLEEKDAKWSLLTHIEKLASEKKCIQEELDSMTQRCCLAMEKLSDLERREVCSAMGDGIPEEQSFLMSGMLESFMKRWTDDEEHSTEDYGWLEPNGTFHAVEWAKHQEWAEQYIRENMTEEEWLLSGVHMEGQFKTASYNTFGDYLVDRGWVLLHSPSQGIASPTRNPVKRYTKAQQEFLYDYYMERKCQREANEIYEEDF